MSWHGHAGIPFHFLSHLMPIRFFLERPHRARMHGCRTCMHGCLTCIRVRHTSPTSQFTVLAEVMARYSNLILTDAQGFILACAQQVGVLLKQQC